MRKFLRCKEWSVWRACCMSDGGPCTRVHRIRTPLPIYRFRNTTLRLNPHRLPICQPLYFDAALESPCWPCQVSDHRTWPRWTLAKGIGSSNFSPVPSFSVPVTTTEKNHSVSYYNHFLCALCNECQWQKGESFSLLSNLNCPLTTYSPGLQSTLRIKQP